MNEFIKKITGRTGKIAIICFIIWAVTLSGAIFFTINGKILRETVTNQYARVIPVTLHPEPGINIAGDIFIPLDNSSQVPAVIIQHGLSGRKESILSMALNFVKRGFVAATFDLRSHGRSNGYCTLGNKESDDMVFEINYLKNIINGTYANISAVGLIGHSLGAQTVILASYKSGVNSTVAISPPTVISQIFSFVDDFAGIQNYISFYNPWEDPEFEENLTLTNIVNDRTADHPNPRNLLMITTTGDFTVPSEGVYNLFKNVTHLENPEAFTLYGSFSIGNATQYNIHDGFIHGDQQFTFMSPIVTRDAMNWTERALIGEAASIARGEIDMSTFIMDNFNINWMIADVLVLISFLGLATGFMMNMYYRRVVKRTDRDSDKFSTFDELNQFYDISILQSSFDEKAPKTRKNLLINCVLILIFTGLISIVLSKMYFTGVIYNFILEAILHLMGGVAISLLIFLVLWYFVSSRFIKNLMGAIKQSQQLMPNKTGILANLGIAINGKAFFESVLIGLGIGLYYPVVIVSLSEWSGAEHFLDPIKDIPGYILSVVLIGVFFVLIAMFVYGYLYRYANKDKPERHLVNIIKSLLIQSIIMFLIGFVLMLADPLSNYLLGPGLMVIVAKVTLALAIMLIVLILGLAVIIYSKFTKSIMIPIAFCAVFLPWLFYSLVPLL